MMNLINNHDLINENDMEKIIEWIIKIEHREANKYESDSLPKNEMIYFETGYISEFSSVSITENVHPDTALLQHNPSFSNLSQNKDQINESTIENKLADVPKHDDNYYEEIKDTIMNDMKRVILRNFDK